MPSALLAAAFAIPATAQYCPSLPPDSPVLSQSPDDIPPGATAALINVSGNTFYALPNHEVAYVQIGPNEQKVWFSVDVHFIDVNHGSNYYNRRYRANESSPWYWQYSQSQPFSDPNNPIGFVAQVLYSDTPKYSAYSGGALYKYVLYTFYQPAACNGAVGGIAMVSLSIDGICWTPAVPMHRSGGPSFACTENLGSELVPVESMGAVDGGNTIYLMGIEGDNSILGNMSNMNHNYVSWGHSSPTDVVDVTVDPDRDMSDAGLFNPRAFVTEYTPAYIPDRFRSYAYFFNMQIAWDAVNGDLYVSRGYPYPYDRCAANPTDCQSAPLMVPSIEQTYEAPNVWNSLAGAYQSVWDCGGRVALYPNRYQIYKMNIGSLANFSTVHTGTWMLVTDSGNGVGYESDFNRTGPRGETLPPQATALVTGQTAGTRDAGAASFLVDRAGQLVRTGGIGYVFAASTLREHLSAGPCQTTGAERVVMTPIP